MSEPVLLMALAAILAVEGTSVGQFMLSRPLVAGAITGGLLGQPESGLLIGCLLELYYLPALPVGGGRYPEPGPATVLAAAVAAGFEGPGGLALAAFLGLSFGILGGWVQRQERRLMTRVVPDAGDPLLPRRLLQAHWLGPCLDALRGAAVVGSGLWLARGLGPVFVPVWPIGPQATLLLLVVAACIPLGSLLATLGGLRRRGPWTIGGIVLGVLLGAVL